MIEPIQHSLTVPLGAADAFSLFATRLVEWWPREYTWSQDVLVEIGIEPRSDGLCFEVGPHGFGCDWGRVLDRDPPRRLVLAWQIGPHREPVPNPAHASTVAFTFDEQAPDRTVVAMSHGDFDRHGDGAAAYRDALAAAQGWPFILGRFAAAARG